MTMSSAARTSVLFVCSHNSARSQMAESFARRLAGDRLDIASAGLLPRDIHPLTVTVMQEIGHTLDGQTSKSLKVFLGKRAFTYAIMVCPTLEAQCPKYFPGTTKLLYWPFDDPAAATGDATHQLAIFRRVRDEISKQVATWISTLSSPASIRD